MLEVLAHRSFRQPLLLFFLTFFALLSQPVAGQYINGQTFTNGLSIIDSPSPNNPGHAGSSINIAIDVSGDGKLPSAASLPGSGYSTGFVSLEIYLVSSETNINMTVSAGPALLTGEPGSTVKHLNWPIPTCIPAGNYNLTFYESSLFNSEGIFTITPIPIPISNPSTPGAPAPPGAPSPPGQQPTPSGQPTPPGACTDNLNLLQAQPQSSSPLPQSPFAPGSPISASATLSAVSSTPSPSRMVTIITGSPILTLTITLSDGVLNLPTVTVTAQPTPTTVVLLSTSIVTETDQGTVTTFTQTNTVTSVTMVTPSSQPDNLNNSPGFIPVNAASSLTSSAPLCLIFASAWTLLLYSRMF
ncbi:hypothetical protein MVEN_01898600 [Mycena venus]|uniref:Uncharacterized protein n=1 Tax=Mycena venus TaxID=2733690 RepID=A0A8H7CKT5_9AGAR|nr:hypothetical protein MVEN_01898600 [Mycena venus]